MRQAFLKKIRAAVTLIFFLATLVLFLDFTSLFSSRVVRLMLYLQFIPSILKFACAATVAASGFICIIFISFLFGRVYCSSICPLGTLQDICSRISGKLRIRKRFRYSKPLNLIRYLIPGLTVFILLFSSVLLLGTLDPFSLSGKIFSNVFRPVYYIGNNLLARVLQIFNIFTVYSVPVKIESLPPVIFSLCFFIFIIVLSVFRGRWYCNVICPVGTVLGLISRFSFLRIRIDKFACTSCGRCANLCKSECIDIVSRKVDFSRCVACFNCIGACPENGIGYRNVIFAKEPKATNLSRRNFFKTTILGTTSVIASKTLLAGNSAKLGKSRYPVTPPGSVSILHYTSKCTACHLCVSVCPTKVLQPTFMEYGISGLFQPKMDYHAEYCNFECVRCSEVCPTGAILPVTKDQKPTLQIGTSHFISNLCIVVTKNTACGACSEHCPTKAVEMMPYKGELTIPTVDNRICVGCGACEYACPVKPDKAIYVESSTYHGKAMKASKKGSKNRVVKKGEDFPF